jgi:hypothetical protein
METAQQYYSNPNNFGNYQWFSFSEVIEELEAMATDHDSYIHNARRSIFIQTAKRGIKILQRDVRKRIEAMEFTVPTSLLFPYPQDYVNWISLSVVHNGTLFPIFVNKGMNTSLALSQDANGNLLFNSDGYLIKNESENITGEGKCYKINDNKTNAFQTQGIAIFNDNQGRISFGSDMVGKSIVLEYYSDGLFAWGLTPKELESFKLKPILIHKDLKEVLIKYIYQEIIGYRRNVPANEKQKARLEYKTYLHQAKLDRLGFNLYTAAKLVR